MNNISNIRRILFDLDGTLIIHNKDRETEELIEILNLDSNIKAELTRQITKYFEGYNTYFKGKIVTWDVYNNLLLNSFKCLTELGITPNEIEEALIIKGCIYSKVATGTVDTLQYLTSKGYELCIATNGMYTSQVKILKKHGLLNFFEKVYAWDNTYAKPDIRFLYRTLSEVEAKNTAFIGDSLKSDIQLANKAGMLSIGYNLHGNARGIYPDISIQKMQEIKKIF